LEQPGDPTPQPEALQLGQLEVFEKIDTRLLSPTSKQRDIKFERVLVTSPLFDPYHKLKMMTVNYSIFLVSFSSRFGVHKAT